MNIIENYLKTQKKNFIGGQDRMNRAVLLVQKLLPVNIAQTLQEREGAQSVRVFNSDVARHCLDQPHETLQLWRNVIWGENSKQETWDMWHHRSQYNTINRLMPVHLYGRRT